MAIDMGVLEESKEESVVVFDESLHGKNIDAISDPKISLDFKDDGKKVAPIGKQNLMCPGQRFASKKFRQRYDEMAWMCDVCGEMHPKRKKCKEE